MNYRLIFCSSNINSYAAITIMYTLVDTDPPKITNCQGVFYNFADRTSALGTVIWSEPSVSDNHDISVNMKKESTVSIGDKLPSGTYHVRYSATDEAGNEALPCEMKIVMKGEFTYVYTSRPIFPL